MTLTANTLPFKSDPSKDQKQPHNKGLSHQRNKKAIARIKTHAQKYPIIKNHYSEFPENETQFGDVQNPNLEKTQGEGNARESPTHNPRACPGGRQRP
jgi:hypothetical protein